MQGPGNIEPDEEHFNFDGIVDERVEIKYARDAGGNWTSRSVFAWDPDSSLMVEIERDTRTIEYYYQESRNHLTHCGVYSTRSRIFDLREISEGPRGLEGGRRELSYDHREWLYLWSTAR